MLMGQENPNNIGITISTILNAIINSDYVFLYYDYIIKTKGIDLVQYNENLFSLESKLSTIIYIKKIY